MKKFVSWALSIKTLAAWVFAGLMCAYVAAGYLYVLLIDRGPFNFTIPFIFVLEAVGLSIVIAALWRLLFGQGRAADRLRFFARLIIFACLLAGALAVCLLVFFPFHTDWAKLWLIVAGCVVAAIIALSAAAELYPRAHQPLS